MYAWFLEKKSQIQCLSACSFFFLRGDLGAVALKIVTTELLRCYGSSSLTASVYMYSCLRTLNDNSGLFTTIFRKSPLGKNNRFSAHILVTGFKSWDRALLVPLTCIQCLFITERMDMSDSLCCWSPSSCSRIFSSSTFMSSSLSTNFWFWNFKIFRFISSWGYRFI